MRGSDLYRLVYIDIETVPSHAHYRELSPALQKLYLKKARAHDPLALDFSPEAAADDYFQNAALMPEFGRIVCISMGFFTDPSLTGFYTFSFAGSDEKYILGLFIKAVEFGIFKAMSRRVENAFENYSADSEKRRDLTLCAHNLYGFDLPFITRRLLLHSLDLPRQIDISNKKPWEIHHKDTQQYWRFGMRSSASLELLCELFGVSTPKDDIEGSEVARVFYKEQNLERIVSYCQKDVTALAAVAMAMQKRDHRQVEFFSEQSPIDERDRSD